ncbi:MAG: hypothetical protein ACR2NX_00360 [Chthoniobacterales bacterium]
MKTKNHTSNKTDAELLRETRACIRSHGGTVAENTDDSESFTEDKTDLELLMEAQGELARILGGREPGNEAERLAVAVASLTYCLPPAQMAAMNYTATPEQIATATAPEPAAPPAEQASASSPRSLLLDYQALASCPKAQTAFHELHAQDLEDAAEAFGDAQFSNAEIATARAAQLRAANDLIAQSQGLDGRARMQFLDDHEAALDVALALAESL